MRKVFDYANIRSFKLCVTVEVAMPSDGNADTSEQPGPDDESRYGVIVVGGGPGGLTTALYTTRLNHETALVDRGGGRAAMMLDTHNVIGVAEETSGTEFLERAVAQLGDYGTEVYRDTVTDIEQLEGTGPRFEISTSGDTLWADAVVLATGFTDERPDPPLPRTGRGLHYCLHCDEYMFIDESVYVMGHNDSAAYVAMIMLNFTDDVDLLLRGDEPTWSERTGELLRAHPVNIIELEIESMFKDEENSAWLGGFEFEDGTTREYKGGFAMYGSDYNDELATQLGLERNDDGSIAVDENGQTTVNGVYAVGDLTPGNNQIPIAMGKGAQAGLAIHKELRAYPKTLKELHAADDARMDVQAPSDDD
jgi:thioredoxin reductase (NADPH)